MVRVLAQPSDTRSRPLESVQADRSSSLFMLGIAAVTLLALALRLEGLNRESLWLDEGYTLYFSHLALPRLILVGGAHEHPPLYYVLVHFAFQVRDSYLAPRYISAFAGVASVAAIYLLGARLFGRPVGLVAAVLLAISPFHLWYSQDGRAYALAGLLVLLSYLSLFVALDARGKGPWILYSICTALCLYTEYTTTFVLLPQALLWLRAHRLGTGRRLAISWLGTVLLFAPWLGVVVLDTASISGRYWIPPPGWTSVENTVLQFLGMRTPCPSPPCVNQQVAVPLLTGHEGIVVAAVIAGAVVGLVVTVLRRRLITSVLLLWLMLPFALVLLIALKRSLYLDRVFLDASFPLYILLGGMVVAVARSVGLRILAALPAALVLGSSVSGAQTVASTTVNPDWRALARDLAAAYRPGQAVVLVPGVVASIVHPYLPASWHPTRERQLWYRAYLDVMGWTHRFATTSDARLRDLQLGWFARGEGAVWLVTMDYTGTDETRLWFEQHGYHLLLSELYAGDTRLELWDRGTPDSLGPAVVPARGYTAWRKSGKVAIRGNVIHESGRASVTHAFRVVPGAVYSVNVEWRSLPPALPRIRVGVYDRTGTVVGVVRDRYGYLQESFPRTEWYSLPADGVWLSQPFGFVAPPGSRRATIAIDNLWGETWWRAIAVYRER